MNKELKSLLSSLGVILIYFYATAGIVKLLCNTSDDYKFEGRIKFLILLSLIFSLVFIIVIGDITTYDDTMMYYKMLILGQFAYILIGVISNILIKR